MAEDTHSAILCFDFDGTLVDRPSDPYDIAPEEGIPARPRDLTFRAASSTRAPVGASTESQEPAAGPEPRMTAFMGLIRR